MRRDLSLFAYFGSHFSPITLFATKRIGFEVYQLLLAHSGRLRISHRPTSISGGLVSRVNHTVHLQLLGENIFTVSMRHVSCDSLKEQPPLTRLVATWLSPGRDHVCYSSSARGRGCQIELKVTERDDRHPIAGRHPSPIHLHWSLLVGGPASWQLHFGRCPSTGGRGEG